METNLTVMQRTNGGIVEITFPDGSLFRITFEDEKREITVQSIDGAMAIMPRVSNEVRIEIKSF